MACRTLRDRSTAAAVRRLGTTGRIGRPGRAAAGHRPATAPPCPAGAALPVLRRPPRRNPDRDVDPDWVLEPEVWLSAEDNVCRRHRVWIGPGATTYAQQLDLTRGLGSRHYPDADAVTARIQAIARNRRVGAYLHATVTTSPDDSVG